MALIKEERVRSMSNVYDAEGWSLLLRIAAFVMQITENKGVLEDLPSEEQIVHAKNLALFTELAGDNISVKDSTPIWKPTTLDVDPRIVDLVAKAQNLLATWSDGIDEGQKKVSLQNQLLDASSSVSTASYYNARAFASIAGESVEKTGRMHSTLRDQIRTCLKGPEYLKAAALISSAPNDQEKLRFCNETIANWTGRDLGTDQDQILSRVICLNGALANSLEVLNDIPQQRLVFFVKHVTAQLLSCSKVLQCELLKTLQAILPPLKGIYGSFWADILQLLLRNLDADIDEETLPLLAFTVR